MRCPFCGCPDTQVKDTRTLEDQTTIRRRRLCADCSGRFTTYERVQLRDLIVEKSDGRKEPFDRTKLMRSVEIALRKRPVADERVERMITGIVRQLEARSDGVVRAQEIGSAVMTALKELDGVAYVRFASVYRDFTEAEDFRTVLNELADTGLREAAPTPTVSAPAAVDARKSRAKPRAKPERSRNSKKAEQAQKRKRKETPDKAASQDDQAQDDQDQQELF